MTAADTRQCRQCLRQRPQSEVFTCQRQGGGTFRRGGRWYWSSLCHDCALRLLSGSPQAGRTISGWSVRGMTRHLDTMGLLP